MRARSFEDLRARAAQHGAVRLSVAGGNDPRVIEAVVSAIDTGLVSEAVVSGDAASIAAEVPLSHRAAVRCLEAADPAGCGSAAVAAVRAGQADVLMKGHIDSGTYLRAVVDRERGLRAGGVMSNVTVAGMPSLPQLIAATDNGIAPAPDLDQKRQIVLNTRPLFRGLGIAPVRVAAVCASEKVSETLPATLDAAALAEESRAGRFPGFAIGGPFGYDVAVSRAAAAAKGLDGSDAAGDADLLLFPNIEAANAVAKSWKFHGEAETGSIVLGGRVPILLNSRADGATSRINALLLAIAVLAGGCS